jgi:FAD/FMN-containing dehydrogenase
MQTKSTDSIFKNDAATLYTYSRDASIFEVTPSGVFFPANSHDLKKIISDISQQKLRGEQVSVSVRNGGTCMSGGSLTEGFVIDLCNINTISHVDVAHRKITVGGGTMHLAVEKALKPHRLLFAPYTSSHDICGIGGMIGNNASGEKSIKYGPTSQNIDSMKVMLSDSNEYHFRPLNLTELDKKFQQNDFEGHLYREVASILEKKADVINYHHPRTRKNASGYALWEIWDTHKQNFNLGRIFIGAQGTLGIVTEATLKLTRQSPARRMIVAPINELAQLPGVVKAMLRFRPAICETFDHHTYRLALTHLPEDAANAHIAHGQHMVVMAVYEADSQDKADTAARKALDLLQNKHSIAAEWVKDNVALESFLVIRRKSFKMLLENPSKSQRAMAFLEDTIVPLEHYGEFIGALEAILSDYDLIYTYAGHIGDGSIRLVPLINVEADNAADLIIELETRVNRLVMAFDGSISVDHNDGIIRTPYLEEFFGQEMVDIFKQIKQLFDPHEIFNPGKKVGGSFDFLKQHIIRKNI